MCEHDCAEVDDLNARIAKLEDTLRFEQDSARKVESQYLDVKTLLNKARDVFEVIYSRDEINLDEDSDYADLAGLLGFDPMVEVWITVQAEWSQKVSLPRGYDDSKVEVITEVPDYLTVTYKGDELDDYLTSDKFEVEVSE